LASSDASLLFTTIAHVFSCVPDVPLLSMSPRATMPRGGMKSESVRVFARETVKPFQTFADEIHRGYAVCLTRIWICLKG
jgi:hypothetical protein